MPASSTTSSIAWFSELGLADLDQVGGKNSSLGEMIRGLASAGVRVPNGFATTADAYRRFIGREIWRDDQRRARRHWTPRTSNSWQRWVAGSATQ